MSYSEHRPGRFGSQGQIEFDVTTSNADEPLYIQDIREAERREAEGLETYDADGPTDPFGGVPDERAADHDEAPVNAGAKTEPQPEPEFDIEPLVVPRRKNEAEPLAAEQTEEQAVEETTDPGEPLFATEPLVAASEEDPATESTVPTRRSERPRKVRRPMRRLAILGGADGYVLDQVPAETGRFVQMFFVIAGTALISGISMVFALTTGVKAAVWLAIPLAIMWALIIFNLDRFLTSTMRSSTKIGKLIALALPRVIMAAIIGVVVAEPLVLQIFANDIEREVNATNIVQAQGDQEAVATGPEKQALDAATQRLADLENQAATGVVVGTTTDSATLTAAQAKVDGITTQMTTQQGVIDQARLIYQCELTGAGAGTVEGCTGISGEGASSDAAKSQLDQAQATYDALAVDLRTANEELTTAQESSAGATSANEDRNREAAKAQLPTAQATYDAALVAYNERADAVASGNAGASGLLSQITALNSLSEKEPTLGFAHWMIAALFFMIELLPVLVKVLTSHGQPSLYEETAGARRQVESDRVRANAFRDRADIATGTTVGVSA